MDYFIDLAPLLKTFWYIALPASLIFLIQTILTFIGGDAGDGLEADFDGDLSDGDTPFQLFSFRNLINFLLGFSWTGICFYNSIQQAGYLIALALFIGIGFVYVFFLIIKQVQKLAEDNSFKLKNTLNKTAEVYLRIPANKSGAGKVLISVHGATHELAAMTEQDSIAPNTLVRVVRLENEQILIVETL